MSSLSDRLRCRVDLFGKIQGKNELGEIDFTYGKINTLWAEITPQNGSQTKGQANTLFSEISHRFVIRSNAVKYLENDMYFIYKNQRYDIKYYNPNYKYSDNLEVFCSLLIEGGNDGAQ